MAEFMEMTPDREVQVAIRRVFAKFQQLGSTRQVLLWHRQENILLPSAVPGRSGQQVSWQPAVFPRILGMLKNPAYAGAFVYGRTRTRTIVKEGRARKTRGHEAPPEQWEVLIRDHHPGYISWDEFERNQRRLADNSAMGGYHGLPRVGWGGDLEGRESARWEPCEPRDCRSRPGGRSEPPHPAAIRLERICA